MSVLGGPAAPVPTGSEAYYRQRLSDVVRRRPDLTPPTYYADYGDKCLHQFVAIEPQLTPSGQDWLRTTLRLLQEKMEERRREDPEGFALLETDGEAFNDFAFSTHSEAYVEAGLFELPLDDLWKIIRTPDVVDLLRPKGLVEIADVLEQMSLSDAAAIIRRSLPGHHD